MRHHRSNALPEALEVLSDAIQNGTAYRTRRYDVYLNQTESIGAILLLPGGGVETAAYASPSVLLAQKGCTVVVVSAEPLRWPSPTLGMDSKRMRNIMTNVEKKRYKYDSPEWFLIGHSLGTFAATHLVGDEPFNISSMCMWGAAPFTAYVKDLSRVESVDVCVVQGSNDVVVERYATPVATKHFWNLLPSSAQEYTIKKGTHGGFADYLSGHRYQEDDEGMLDHLD